MPRDWCLPGECGGFNIRWQLTTVLAAILSLAASREDGHVPRS
jgi:hypothetical protein